MNNRVNHTYQTSLYAFVHRILVTCPQCNHRAVVHAEDFNSPAYVLEEVKVVCTGCGYNKKLHHISKRHDPKQKRGNVLKFGSPVDPFFHLPAWLQTEVSGNILWAYNLEHLDFLAAHVGAKHRERHGSPLRVRSIGARLPRWMTAAGHRDMILREIDKLREKAG